MATTYHISASLLGSGYDNVDNFLIYTGSCGVPGSEIVKTRSELLNGFSLTLPESIQTIYLVPFTPLGQRSLHCRLGCNHPSSSLTLSGYIAPPTPAPTTPAPTTPAPTTPAPTTPAPSTPTPVASYSYQTFGNMTISRASSTTLQLAIYNTSQYVRVGAATNLAYYLAGNQYVGQNSDAPITSGIRIFTSEQSIFLDPECSYLYLNVNAYTNISTSNVYWYDSSAANTTYVLIRELSTLPANLQTRQDSFVFLITLDDIC